MTIKDDLIILASYQEPASFGANTGGVNQAFLSAAPNAAYDGWLTVGITGGDTAGALGSVGIDWDSWTDSAGITTNNGAVFWMSPGDGPHANAGAIPVAQVTIDTSSALNAAVNVQGRMVKWRCFLDLSRCPPR